MMFRRLALALTAFLLLAAGSANAGAPPSVPEPALDFSAIAASLTDATFSADATALASVHVAGGESVLTAWSVSADDIRPVRAWPLDPAIALGKQVLLSPDGRYLTIPGTGKDQLVVVDIASGQALGSISLPGGIHTISAGAFGPAGVLALATGQDSSTLSLLHLGRGTKAGMLPLPDRHRVDTIHFSPDGRSLLAAMSSWKDGRLEGYGGRIWNTATLLPAGDFAMRDDGRIVLAATFLWDRMALALSSTDRSLRLLQLPDLAEFARLDPCDEDMPCTWLDPLVGGPGAMLGLVLSDVNRTRNLFRLFHVDGNSVLPLLAVDLYADAAHALAVSAQGEWRIAAPSGLLRYQTPDDEAIRIEQLVAEASRLAGAGFPKAAGDRLLDALALDPERVGERAVDLIAGMDLALAGEIERRREILLRDAAFSAYSNGKPLFVYGYLALLAGHPTIAEDAARRLAGDGAIPIQFDTPALALYLTALITAWQGDTDAAFDQALAARELSNPDVAAFLMERMQAHPAAFAPFLADPVRLGVVTGIATARIPGIPSGQPQATHFPLPDGSLAQPQAPARGIRR